MKDTNKIIITVFTDPMMGLSYECEPVFRKLETHFPDQILFQYVMSGLVPDVSYFMTAAERALPEKESVSAYCKRLAQIYKSEEPIGGLPINMDGFHLFDDTLRSSYPLNIAYKAAELADESKAEAFLYHLRYATIAETRQTTKEEEILRVVRQTGIDEAAFLKFYKGGMAEKAFRKDLAYTKSLGIHSLPTCLVQYQGKSLIVSSLISYDDFLRLIREITNGKIHPQVPIMTSHTIKAFFQKHPLISKIEIGEAFDFSHMEAVNLFIRELSQYGIAEDRIEVTADDAFVSISL